MTNEPDVCLFHAECADGFSSAWTVSQRWPNISITPVFHGKKPPEISDKRILIVDFSYNSDILEQLVKNNKSITIIDHHKTAENSLKKFIRNDIFDMNFSEFESLSALNKHPPIRSHFDMTHSGAILTWNFCFPSIDPPLFLKYIEDRDLWKFSLPFSDQINTFIDTYDYTLDDWNYLFSHITENNFNNFVEIGNSLIKKRNKDVSTIIKNSTRRMIIGGIEVPVANCPLFLASHVASKLAQNAPFAATYFDDDLGQRIFSLRSADAGTDVSKIATLYNGGGHKHASGFQMEVGWEGDESPRYNI